MIISDNYPLHMWQGEEVEVLHRQDGWFHVVLVNPKISTTGTPITDFWVHETFLEGV